MFRNRFAGKRVLVTGHSGFKGSWLSLWLQQLGAEVIGFALEPDTNPSHWDLLRLSCSHSFADIRDENALVSFIKGVSPDLVFHLAAQPLVRASYENPTDTWSANVMGTINLLNACRDIDGLAGIIVVTTDKVYENLELGLPFKEGDALGGNDPYSASKAACELVVQSFRKSFFKSNKTLIASVRAGNVIGGGDWAKDRLIPDIVLASNSEKPVKIRYPSAVRPWQHVLDSLSGYLCLAQTMLEGDSNVEGAWNFGPDSDQNYSVKDMLSVMTKYWPDLRWLVEQEEERHEALLLKLNCNKARESLNWRPVWQFEETVMHTALWYQHYYKHEEVLSVQQLKQYQEDAKSRGVFWAC